MSYRPPQTAALYGGQALIEGVMIRARTAAAIAVRAPSGEIVRRRLALPAFARHRARRVPFVRGIIILLEAIVTGARAINISASIAYAEEDDSTQEEDQEQDSRAAERASLIITYTVAVVIGIGLFVLAPIYATEWITTTGIGPAVLIANLAEGFLRITLLIAYIGLIGLLKDIRRMYAYHGAEHKTIAAAEAGVPLTPERVIGFPKEHPRCGTAFLITVAILAVAALSFVPREPVWLLIGSRIVLIPFVMGVGYELIRFASLSSGSPFAYILNLPNLLTQKLTTRQPDESMLEVAIAAFEYALELDQEAERRELA